MRIQTDLTFRQLLDHPAVSGFREFLLANCNVPDLDLTLAQMQQQFPDWVADSIIYGLRRLFALLDDGQQVAYDIYPAEELAAQPDKQGTKLFYFPGKAGMPFVIVCPGGGYNAVCTLKEGFTTAARLNELGYSAFILSYRVAQVGILPKPLEDLAAALRLILTHPAEFPVCPDNYAIAGFSSGGHLAGEWGTDHCGAEKYGLPKPSAIFLAYPASDTALFQASSKASRILRGMLGENYTDSDVAAYNVNANISDGYPPTYIWHCKDDPIVPIQTAYTMIRELEQHRRPFRFREVAHGGHGFGLGEYSEAKGWLEEAVHFWEQNS